MIKLIAALDSKKGIANDHGIPWQGKLPTDINFFRSQTIHSDVLMGWVTYTEFNQPLSDRNNFVLSNKPAEIRQGFLLVTDLARFLQQYRQNPDKDLWVIGGARVFAQTLNYADELYLTRLNRDFDCTKFFPDFENQFELIEQSPPQTENDITFQFETWRQTQL